MDAVNVFLDTCNTQLCTTIFTTFAVAKEMLYMQYISRIISTAIALFTIFSLSAQTGLIRGNVYDKETGEPVIYCNVYLEGTTIGTTTDLDGFYTLPNVPVGTYKLQATFIGYDTASVDTKVFENGIVYKSLYINESSVSLGVVNISAKKDRAKREVQISTVRVSPRQIKALPSTGGEADIAQYLQIIPGVISTGDQGGQLYIRGGSPVQNKILLDGLNIYNPFHSIGFFSVFETELIKNVDVLTGGFGAEHGGRISAVVDIQTRDGSRKEFGGVASASPFMGKILLEGPLTKYEEGKTSTSFVLTGKKSIIDRTSPTLYPYATDSDTLGLPFAFQDLYAKFAVNGSNGSRLNIFGFNFEDTFDNPAVARVGWKNKGAGANFNIIPGNSNMVIGGLVGFTNYNVGIDESDGKPRSSDIRELTAALDFKFFGQNKEFNYGVEMRSIRTDFQFVNPFGLELAQVQNTTELSAFFKYKQIFGDLVFEPSIRFQYYASLGAISPEPRFGLKYNISEKLRFKAAGGIYTQNLLSTDNERDVVSLFTGFLTGPESQVRGLDGTNVDDKLQRSRHLIAGFEYDLTDKFTINIEGYFKDFPQLVIVNRNKLETTDPNYATEEGEAYGVDFSGTYEAGNIYIYGTYSLGKVERFDGFQTYPTVFDRRHNINLLGTYAFGAKKDFEFSLRWNFGTGFPFTKTQGFYNYLSFLDGVSTDYLTSNPDDVGIIFSEERNGGRLPTYHRMDVSLKKRFDFSKRFGIDLIASVTNAYNRENIFYFDRIEYDRVDQLPIIPSLSIKADF